MGAPLRRFQSINYTNLNNPYEQNRFPHPQSPHPTTQVVLKEQASKEAVEALGLTQKHLKRLKIKFEEIDLDQSGSIDSEEFFEVLEEARSPFTDALFALIDLDGSGTIEFEEFIRVCVTYCMYTKEDILRFCFETFDKDGSGTIDEKGE